MLWIPIVSLIIAMALAIGGVWSIRRWPVIIQPAQLTALVRKNLRRIWILLAGSTIILVGVLIAPLPGPGFVLLGPIGLALIATEFAWARILLKRINERSSGVQSHVDRLASKTALWMLPLVWISYWAAVAIILRYDPIPAWIVWPVSSAAFTPVLLVSWRVVKTWRAASRPAGKAPPESSSDTRDAA